EAWLEPGGLRVRAAAHPALRPGQEVAVHLPKEALVVLDD
ncbi:MAG: Fe3+/spermidine/putrescine ABC transporter ATP-binding protein, partial [Meiothermus sp.]